VTRPGIEPIPPAFVLNQLYHNAWSYLHEISCVATVRHQTEGAEADREQYVWLSGIWQLDFLRQAARSSCDQVRQTGKCLQHVTTG